MITKEKLCLLCSELNLCSSKKVLSMIERLDFAKTVASIEQERDFITELIGNTQYTKLLYSANSDFVERIENNLAEKQIGYLTYYSENYPSSLRDIGEPPACLYYKGDVSLLNSDCIAVVGSRKASSYGKRVVAYFVSALSHAFTVVSGLAYGIDAEAHKVTLESNGKTIAILGSGIENVYPKENVKLAFDIIKCGGLLLSEYPPYVNAEGFHFIQRNRLVSGLSKGVLVAEAGVKSGTFSTIDFALEQGKDVFVVGGEIFDANYAGCNDLIKRMQGCMVTTPSDITDYYNVKYVNGEKKKSVQLSIAEQQLVELLSFEKLHFDEIVLKSKMDIADVNYLLANLELKSIISKLPGNYYRLNGENK